MLEADYFDKKARNELKALLIKKYPLLQPSDGNFSAAVDGDISWDNVPLPGVLHYAYCNILGFPSFGPWEKVAWVICGRIFKHKYCVSLTKFGPRLSIESPCEEELVREIKNVQFCLVKETVKYLQSAQSKMIEQGDFTVNNKSIPLFNEYQFFRDLAIEAYKKDPPDPVPLHFDSDGNPTSFCWNPHKPAQEGGYLAKAAITSFFAWLEHVLLLLYPFSTKYESNNIKDFLKMHWKDKWKNVFLSSDISADKALNLLHNLAEAYRNPFSHGLIKRTGESFSFHIPGAGAVPFLENLESLNPEVIIAQISEKQFNKIIADQDSVLTLINQSSLRLALKYISSGIDVYFDQSHRGMYLSAQISDESMESLIDEISYIEDKYRNMDF